MIDSVMPKLMKMGCTELPIELTRRILHGAMCDDQDNSFSNIRESCKLWEQQSYDIIFEHNMNDLCEYLSAMRINSPNIPKQYILRYAAPKNYQAEKTQRPWLVCKRCNQVRTSITETQCCKKQNARILNAFIGPTIAVVALSILWLKMKK